MEQTAVSRANQLAAQLGTEFNPDDVLLPYQKIWIADDSPLMREVVFPEPAPAFIMKLRGGTFPRQFRRSMSAWVSGLFARLLMLGPYRDSFSIGDGVGRYGIKFDPHFVL